MELMGFELWTSPWQEVSKGATHMVGFEPGDPTSTKNETKKGGGAKRKEISMRKI